MIIDNADNVDLLYGPESRLADELLPRSTNGSILLTTRDKKVGVKFAASPRNVIVVLPITTFESEALLAAKLGDTESNKESIRELSIILEKMPPLAIIQAAAFIAENSLPVAEYLLIYRESDNTKIQLLSENFEVDIRDADIKNPVATVWLISFEHIREYRLDPIL